MREGKEERTGRLDCEDWAEAASLLANTDLEKYGGRISSKKGKNGTSRVGGKELER